MTKLVAEEKKTSNGADKVAEIKARYPLPPKAFYRPVFLYLNNAPICVGKTNSRYVFLSLMRKVMATRQLIQ